jgi:transglutaminase-like putative cysteine protease
MKICIKHRTTYNYKQPVSFGQHKIMIRPREGHDLHIESSILDIKPAHTIHWMRDVNGNSIAKVDFTEEAKQLMIYSELMLQHYDANPLDFIVDEGAVNYPFIYEPDSQAELAAFMHIIYPKDMAPLREWLAQFYKPGDKIETIVLIQNVNKHIHDTFEYKRRDERGVQTPSETLEKNSGSCRDFATLLLEACRCLGLAARFVSGYMQGEGTEAGGASTHAWAEVYLPGAGWKGFDPTCGLMTGAQHVTVAVSRDPENAAPISGSFSGAANSFINIQVDVSVVQVDKPAPVAEFPLQLQIPSERVPVPAIQQQVEQMAQQASVQMDMVIHSEPAALAVS